MTVTGVPPNLVFANKMVDMQRDMCDMKDQIIAKLEQLPEAMKHSLLANFQINGTVPITRNEMQEVISTSIDSLRGSIESSFQLLSHRNENPLVPVEEQNDLTPQNTAVYTTWGWVVACVAYRQTSFTQCKFLNLNFMSIQCRESVVILH